MTGTRKLRVFLCHASQDKPIVRALYQRLNTEGWIDPWLDEEKLLPSQDWDMEIEKAVRNTDVVIVCLSTNSVSKEGYIQHEIRLILRIAGYKPEGVIFTIPIRLDNCTVPMRLELQHHVDFFPEERKEWAYLKLIQALKTRFDQIIIKESKEKSDKHLGEHTNREINKPKPTRKGSLLKRLTQFQSEGKTTDANDKKDDEYIPDWLKTEKPANQQKDGQPPSDDEEDLPDWLK